jgi:hypothetical protein
MLDLTDREDVSFDALPAGKYRCTVVDVDERETKGSETAAMPAGTPYLSIQWRVETPEKVIGVDGTEMKAENRRFFSTLMHTIPEDHPAEKAKRMRGLIYRTLISLGYTEEELTSGSFELDEQDLIGREAMVTVNRREYPPQSGDYQNNVVGVKPVEAGSTSDIL